MWGEGQANVAERSTSFVSIAMADENFNRASHEKLMKSHLFTQIQRPLPVTVRTGEAGLHRSAGR